MHIDYEHNISQDVGASSHQRGVQHRALTKSWCSPVRSARLGYRFSHLTYRDQQFAPFANKFVRCNERFVWQRIIRLPANDSSEQPANPIKANSTNPQRINESSANKRTANRVHEFTSNPLRKSESSANIRTPGT